MGDEEKVILEDFTPSEQKEVDKMIADFLFLKISNPKFKFQFKLKKALPPLL